MSLGLVWVEVNENVFLRNFGQETEQFTQRGRQFSERLTRVRSSYEISSISHTRYDTFSVVVEC